jgi:toxin ParE1/3/4
MAILLKRPLAELDLLDIWDYIADDSPDRADDFLDRVESKLMTLAQNSGLGRKRSDRFSGRRDHHRRQPQGHAHGHTGRGR